MLKIIIKKIEFYSLVTLMCWLCTVTAVLASTRIINDEVLADNLSPVLVYNLEFAKRFGLNPKNAISLDPALYAVALVFKRYFILSRDKESFLTDHHINEMSSRDAILFQLSYADTKDQLNHYALYPLLFSKQVPLSVEYQCYLNLYLNTRNQRSQLIKVPNFQTWYQNDEGRLSTVINSIVDPLPVDDKKRDCLVCDPANRNLAMTRILARDYIQFSRLRQGDWGINSGRQPYPENRLLSSLQGQFLNFLPGISYLSFAVYCPNLSADAEGKGLWLWIENREARSFTLFSTKNQSIVDGYSGFHIPAEITQADNLRRAIAHNEEHILIPKE